MVGENVQIDDAQITGKHNWVKKIGSREITHAPALSPKVKLPQVLTITLPGREKLLIPLATIFWIQFLPQKKGEREENLVSTHKISQLKLVKILQKHL